MAHCSHVDKLLLSFRLEDHWTTDYKMNVGKGRLGSAGSSRIGSAGSGDNRALKNTVTHLQHELMQAKAESQKVNDQLNCLINLVKRYLLTFI